MTATPRTDNPAIRPALVACRPAVRPPRALASGDCRAFMARAPPAAIHWSWWVLSTNTRRPATADPHPHLQSRMNSLGKQFGLGPGSYLAPVRPLTRPGGRIGRLRLRPGKTITPGDGG